MEVPATSPRRTTATLALNFLEMGDLPALLPPEEMQRKLEHWRTQLAA
ncbi:MAG: hypothetical protein ACREJ0_01230 [Geminicoccaceae bacterium]